MKKILQMLPANGWVAMFKQDDGTQLEEDLVCFALIDEDGDTVIQGMSGGEYIDFSESASNFSGYKKVG